MGKRMSPARPSVAGLCEGASLRCRMSSEPALMTANDLVVEIVSVPLLDDIVGCLLHWRLVSILLVAILVLGFWLNFSLSLASTALLWRIWRWLG